MSVLAAKIRSAIRIRRFGRSDAGLRPTLWSWAIGRPRWRTCHGPAKRRGTTFNDALELRLHRRGWTPAGVPRAASRRSALAERPDAAAGRLRPAGSQPVGRAGDPLGGTDDRRGRHADSGADPRAQARAELNVYNWLDYIGEGIIESFEEKYAIKLNYERFPDDIYADTRSSATASGGYDVSYPASTSTPRFIEAGRHRSSTCR